MAKLSEKVVTRTATLAKLTLSKSEIKTLGSQLSGVVEYFDQLNEVDTDNILPTSQTTGLENVYRNDNADPSACLTNNQALSGTDKTENGYIVVPMILENKDA